MQSHSQLVINPVVRENSGFFKIVSMEMELSELLGGKKIDLRTPNELSLYFRNRVMAEAVFQYDSD